ncbi:MAG TPA: DNA-3-methyladenine glycosylase 2 family protein [Gemmataceae bacterium]|nr:DNA-3-methyladenine glycosylase 2 family protein [Gemmataceae bacterium]
MAKKATEVNGYANAFRKARRHLSSCDPLLAQLIKNVGPCTLQPSGEAFPLLVRSIISQMISTKAALAISARVLAAMQPHGLTPVAVAAASEEALRGAGLSRTKVLALKDLAERALSGALPLDQLAELSDEEVIDCLIPVRGIGRWTAEMFLIFSLGRLDVLPVDDFGLRAGVRDVYQLPDLPTRAALRERGEVWRPYRSIATWYFWRSRGGVPQSS